MFFKSRSKIKDMVHEFGLDESTVYLIIMTNKGKILQNHHFIHLKILGSLKIVGIYEKYIFSCRDTRFKY